MQPPELRVMSFNIRYTNPDDGPNYWTHRKDLCIETIRRFDPDLLGLQEVCREQYDDLRRIFPDYGMAGVAREDGGDAGERALILHRRQRFDVLATGDFWLSDTPHVVGSRSWDSKHFRICTWTRLGDRRAERELLHANTHFDDQGVQARTEAAKLLRRKLPELAQSAVIVLTGDFNSTQDDLPYRALTEPGPDKLVLLDSYREIHPRRTTDEGSLHGFNGMTNGPRIDWILHTPHLITAAADIDRHHSPSGQYPSDHFPVTAIFRYA